MEINGKIVLITGAASGIGYEVAKLLVKKGAQVFSFDLNEPQHPVESVSYIQVDITNSTQIQKGLDRVAKPLDILINNAGVMRRGTILETTEEEYDLLFGVMVKGSWLMTKLSQPHLTKDAMLLYMSSRHGMYPPVNPGVYALAKQGIINLAEMIRQTAPNYKVKVACPGPTNTALARFGVAGKALKRKEKIMRPPQFVAAKIIELIEKGKTRLLFDPKSLDYYFE